jgi:hypothetical protein
MNKDKEENVITPRGDSWAAAGLISILLGIQLLRGNDPLLLSLWGIGLLITGTTVAIAGIGMLLRVWE